MADSRGVTYLIADCHFGDDNIRRMEREHFNSVEEMNRLMIEQWNKVVKDGDTVYILGDFGDKGYIDDLKGKKIFIKGDHDEYWNYELPVILNEYWILSHRPMYVNDKMPYVNIFGHVHGNEMYTDFGKHHFCVCAERLDYTPISFEEIKEKIRSCYE